MLELLIEILLEQRDLALCILINIICVRLNLINLLTFVNGFTNWWHIVSANWVEIDCCCTDIGLALKSMHLLRTESQSWWLNDARWELLGILQGKDDRLRNHASIDHRIYCDILQYFHFDQFSNCLMRNFGVGLASILLNQIVFNRFE